MTLVSLPDFVTHNEGTQDFTIEQNADLGIIGEYKVTIRAEIEIPNDHTATTYTKMLSEYDFVIQVNGCQISEYRAVQDTMAMTYTIGQDNLYSAVYAFEQVPACGYEQTVSVIDLPAFVEHQ